MEQPQQTFMTWLNDAYGMEKALIEVLENRVSQTQDHPEIQEKVQEHLEQTKHHAELVRQAIERHGGDVSTIKSSLAKGMGAVQGMASGMTNDSLVKAALSDYSAEHFEIASYRALAEAAEVMDDRETVAMAEEILQDEEEMAAFLEEQLPYIVRETMNEAAATT